MGRRMIYLVRHGQHDATHRPSDGRGPRLTDVGRVQAEYVGQRLQTLPIVAVHSSPLRRAVETTQIIMKAFPGRRRRTNPLLQECIPGIPRVNAEYFAHLSPKMLDTHLKQAESAFRVVFRPARGAVDRHEIVVCHGNIMRYFVCRAMQIPIDTWGNIDIFNCGICEVIVESDGRIMLVSHNDSGHLPYDIRTYS